MSPRRVFVVGVGMTKFEKPGSRDWDYPEMGRLAITRALKDSGLSFDAVEQACVGYVYGDSTCGQRAVYTAGITGIPIYNVNNNCSTGSTALFMARQFVAGGLNECCLALGFEKMEKGSLGTKYTDRTNPMDKHVTVMMETHGMAKAPMAPQLFGNAGREHMKKYGTTLDHFAKIAEKNHRHSANNPFSQFRDVYTLDQIKASPKVHDPLTKLQCCPTSDGAGAALLCSEDFVKKHGLQDRAVEIVGMSMATDLPSSFEEKSMMKAVGYDMTRKATTEALKQGNLSVNDVQVVELHDCFSANELITYEALGLCGEGKAGEFIDKGDNTYGGKYVVNPSGGLISKGHPLGATGLAQCAELCWQIRGLADKRQVKGATAALQHNLGLGGAAVVTIYKKPEFASYDKYTGKVDTGGAPKPTAPAAGAGEGLAAEAVFKQMAAGLNADLVKKVKATYRFDLSGNGVKKSFYVNLKTGSGEIKESSDKADCMITMKDGDFVKLMSGKLNPQAAFMQGKLKVKGNMMLAQKLQLLQKKQAKL